jgi:hypothetical protein
MRRNAGSGPRLASRPADGRERFRIVTISSIGEGRQHFYSNLGIHLLSSSNIRPRQFVTPNDRARRPATLLKYSARISRHCAQQQAARRMEKD